METIFSNIKERILYITEKKGISKEFFFKDLGVTYGNFKGEAKKKALSSDVLATIVSKYPDINHEWLLTGNGNMLKSKSEEKVITPATPPEDSEMIRLLQSQLKDKERIIAMQDKEIASLQAEIEKLTAAIAAHKPTSPGAKPQG